MSNAESAGVITVLVSDGSDRPVTDLHSLLRETGGIVGVAEAHPAVTIFELRNGGRLSLWEGGGDYGQRWEIDEPSLTINPYERLIPAGYEPPLPMAGESVDDYRARLQVHNREMLAEVMSRLGNDAPAWLAGLHGLTDYYY